MSESNGVVRLELTEAEMDAKVDELIALGINTAVGVKEHFLSKGQRLGLKGEHLFGSKMVAKLTAIKYGR